MLEFDDPRWKDLDGAYRAPYDASLPLQALANGADVWDELWDELHHQADVGVASYAAVAKLIELAPRLKGRDWNFYALIATVEVERHRQGNPDVPGWLLPAYEQAWQQIARLAAEDLIKATDGATVHAILSVLAISKGALKLGALIVALDASELDAVLDERNDWSASRKTLR
jgi:hypothetical protein